MTTDYWQKQSNEAPLFAELLWSRPENKQAAGKLTIFGGNGHTFGVVNEAYNTALHNGIGVCKVLLPDTVKKIVGNALEDAEYAPTTNSGSFSRSCVSAITDLSHWSDMLLLAGDFGRNSETAIAIEHLLTRSNIPICITHDAVDFFLEIPRQLMDRENTLVVLSLAQLQKIYINTPTIVPIILSMTNTQLAEALHTYTLEHSAGIIVKHNNFLFLAHNGMVISHAHNKKIWRVSTAAKASVWWAQNKNHLLKAVACSFIP